MEKIRYIFVDSEGNDTTPTFYYSKDGLVKNTRIKEIGVTGAEPSLGKILWGE